MFNTLRNLTTTGCFAGLLSLSYCGLLSAQQPAPSTTLRDTVMRLAMQQQFESADRAIELSLTSKQPDYETFWNYLYFLVNESKKPFLAARLGQKWLPLVRRAAPPAEGRILKETALGTLYGPFRQTHQAADRIAAKRLLEEAVEVNPNVCEAYIHLAMLAALEGRSQVAISMLDRGIETANDEAFRQMCTTLRDAARKEPTQLIAAARGAYNIEQ